MSKVVNGNTTQAPAQAGDVLDASLAGFECGLSCDQLAKPFELIFRQKDVAAAKVIGGSAGVRGLIRVEQNLEATPDLDSAVRDLVQEGCAILRGWDLRRIHALVPTTDTHLHTLLTETGFQSRPGETLFETQLGERSNQDPQLPLGCSIRNARPNDVVVVNNILTSVPEVAFQSWEPEILLRDLDKRDRFFRVAQRDDRIVGVIVGGGAGDIGRVSHLWVSPEERNRRLGDTLVREALNFFCTLKIERVQLITTSGNEVANRFWKSFGFGVSSNTVFLERDL